MTSRRRGPAISAYIRIGPSNLPPITLLQLRRGDLSTFYNRSSIQSTPLVATLPSPTWHFLSMQYLRTSENRHKGQSMTRSRYFNFRSIPHNPCLVVEAWPSSPSLLPCPDLGRRGGRRPRKRGKPQKKTKLTGFSRLLVLRPSVNPCCCCLAAPFPLQAIGA